MADWPTAEDLRPTLVRRVDQKDSVDIDPVIPNLSTASNYPKNLWKGLIHSGGVGSPPGFENTPVDSSPK